MFAILFVLGIGLIAAFWLLPLPFDARLLE